MLESERSHQRGVSFSEYEGVEYALTIDRPFKKVPKNDRLMVFRREERSQFRHIQNGEVGFICCTNELSICIWSGCIWTRINEYSKAPLFQAERTVSYGAGRAQISIIGERTDEYFARPIPLDETYREKVVEWADVLLCKVRHRPQCDACGAFMGIRQKKNRETFWACFGVSIPHAPVWKDWDFALPPDLKQKVLARRREARSLRAATA